MSLVYDPAIGSRLLNEQRAADEHSARADYDVGKIQRHLARKIREEIDAQRAADARATRPAGDFIQHGDRIASYPVGFVDDSFIDPAATQETDIAPRFDAKRAAENRRFQEAESLYLADCKKETGMGASPEEVTRQQSERSEIREQSHTLARILEGEGVQAYRNDAFQLWIWHVHSKVAESIPNFRRICLLPYVAAIVRSSKLAALEYFLDRNPFCRFWTFTSGVRCRLANLRPRIEYLHRKLNRLAIWLRKKWAVDLVFRSTELGSVELTENAGGIEYDADGEPLFHPHTHCVIKPAGYMQPEKWDAMIREIWLRWEHHWDAGKLIRNARECCKYVTKPGDMVRLGRRSPAALARLEAALHGLRLVAPLGELKREIRGRKDAKMTLRRVRTPEGTVWNECPDHNKLAEQDEADREAMFELHQATIADRIDAKGLTGDGIDAPELAARWEFEGSVGKPVVALPCRVLARLRPAIGPRGIKEPRVVIGGEYVCRKTVMNHPLVSRLWAETAEEWSAGCAISVHTGTSTGQQTAADWLADIPERMPPPSPPVWMTENADPLALA